MVQVLVFLLILSVVVIIHELGHFLTARLFGMRVEEFGLGYPPKAKTLFRKNGTEYTLNWLPLGGFVKLLGEDGDSEAADSFRSKALWQRAVVLLAGVVMNFLLGVVLFGTVYTVLGVPTEIEGVKVLEITEGSPAAEALMLEDVVISVDGREDLAVGEFVEYVDGKRGEEVSFTVEREGERVEVLVTPRVDPPEGEGALGVVITDSELKHYPFWQMPFRGAWVGLQEAAAWGGEIVLSLYGLVRDIVTGKGAPADLAGPVGIYQISNQVRQAGILPLLQFVGILSVNLAILNVLPVPALDGGRLVFLFIELLIGKKVRADLEGWINTAGMILLLSLMAVITVNDVLKLIR